MTPVQVATLRFADATQEGPGINSSSCTSVHKDRNKRHVIEYHPWVRQFWVMYYDRSPADKGAELLDAAYIPEARVQYWKPLDGPVVPQAKPGRLKK